MTRGDVVRVELPPPSGQAGREQFGERPAIVIQVDDYSANHGTVVVVPLTSNQQSLRFPGNFILQPTPDNGLDVPSVVLTSQVRAIDKRRLKRTIGQLSQHELGIVEEELRKALGL